MSECYVESDLVCGCSTPIPSTATPSTAAPSTATPRYCTSLDHRDDLCDFMDWDALWEERHGLVCIEECYVQRELVCYTTYPPISSRMRTSTRNQGTPFHSTIAEWTRHCMHAMRLLFGVFGGLC